MVDPTTVRLRALLVIAGCIAVGVVGHVAVVIDLVGDGGASFIRRQSEGYAMIALVIAFWAWLAPGGHPGSRSPMVPRAPTTPLGRWVTWFLAMVTASIVMVAWTSAPGWFVTLKEAVAAVIVVTAYLSWSRNLNPNDEQWALGASTKSRNVRLRYYVGVLALIAITYASILERVLGEALSTWLEENSEAFGAIILLPLYFDLVARSSQRRTRIWWYALLIALPLAAQYSGYPELVMPFVEWLQEMTEAFIAALVVSLFFDLLPFSSDTIRAWETDNTSTSRPSSPPTG